jgi:hypothetical protein
MKGNTIVLKIKKWNWNIFWAIIFACCMGALSNKSIPSILECFIVALIIGLPLGLFLAYSTKDE